MVVEGRRTGARLVGGASRLLAGALALKAAGVTPQLGAAAIDTQEVHTAGAIC